jgi:protein TonB
MRALLIAVTTLCLASPANARKPHPAVPKGNPGTWVLTEDYPASALRSEFEGVVRFVLTIGPDGHVLRCRVTESSGHSSLDNAACAKVQERGEFIPATDKKGRPVQGTWSNSVRWQIPGIEEAPQPGFYISSFTVGIDGVISDCRVEKADGSLDVPEAALCFPGARVKPILGEGGNPVRKRVRVLMRVVHQDLPE